MSVGSVDLDSLYDEAHDPWRQKRKCFHLRITIFDCWCWMLTPRQLNDQMNDRMMDHMVNRMIDVECQELVVMMTKRSKKVLWFVRISRFAIVDVSVLGRMMTKSSMLWFARISRFAIDDCWCVSLSRFSYTYGRQLNDDGTYSILDSWLKGRGPGRGKKGPL